jgi:RNA polymerase sigma-70 factor (ECF subfamily)
LSGDDNEVELVNGCLAGDVACQREFVERFQGLIFGICQRMLAHRHDAEDVTQEVFLRAFRNLHRWDPERPLRPWLLTIVANCCRTYIEQRGRRPIPTDVQADWLPNRPQSRSSDAAEEIQRAMANLRPEYQQCFALFYLQELSIEEVAEVLDCPKGTIKTWLHRARREMAMYFQQREASQNG